MLGLGQFKIDIVYFQFILLFLSSLLNYRKLYKNYGLVLASVGLKRSNIGVKLRDSTDCDLLWKWNLNLIFAYNSLKRNQNIGKITISQDRLSFVFKNAQLHFNQAELGGIAEVFGREAYSFLKVRGSNVLDIGSSVGDSAIFFAMAGAKKVLGLEPFPFSADLAEQNVQWNSVENTVKILNAGYGSKGEVIIESDFKNKVGSDVKVMQKEGKVVKFHSLESLLQLMDEAEIVLKMDCEGCEYYLLKEEEIQIKKIRMMQIEYHYGSEQLIEKLRNCGFEVAFSPPIHSYDESSSMPTKSIGYIFATNLNS